MFSAPVEFSEGLFEHRTCHFKPMKMRSVGIQTVPSSVENRNLSLTNLTKLFKDVCLDFRRKTTVSVFEFLLAKIVKRKRRNVGKGRKNGKTLFSITI